MRIAEVIGRVTLSRAHQSLRGARYVIALPMPLEALEHGSPRRGDEVIAYDGVGRRGRLGLFSMTTAAPAPAP